MKKRFPHILLVLLGLTLFTGCTPDELPPRLVYSFFVAGHGYGKPGVNNVGLHPPLVEQFDLINDYPGMQFGVLTGDFVIGGLPQEFQEVTDQVAAELDVPVYYTMGNHDLINYSYYLSSIGNPQWSFVHERDLFIGLDPNYNGWSIRRKQMQFLQDAIDEHRYTVNHVFVFFHQLLWWEPDNQFQNFPPNSEANRNPPVNFFPEVLPVLESQPAPVVCFAGDIGAHWNLPACMYYQQGQTTFIASGMGGETRDNFVIVEVMSDGSLRYKLVGLNCETGTDCMGALEDYTP